MFKNPILSTAYTNNVTSARVNVGGITDIIKLVPISLVSRFDAPVSGWLLPNFFETINSSAISVIEIAKNSGLYSESLFSNENGDYWLHELQFEIAKNTQELCEFIENNSEVEYFAIVVSRNRDMIVIGSMEQPVRLVEDVGTTGNKTGQNKRAWKISGLVEHPCYFVRNLI